jgi:hypothetical protein
MQVSDVMVALGVDAKPCPVANVLRSQDQVQSDVRRVIQLEVPEVVDVPKVLVHYAGMITTVEVFIRVGKYLKRITIQSTDVYCTDAWCRLCLLLIVLIEKL